ncbi:Uncharacterized protein FWK35_00001201 [Aphis craccivora]|uniref:Uncharacterized protein n=1 Tax=Aphis craccivora TaxID=307492 RepID=A0A6G0ZM93_APHCR|nr:Uncharacterized protein FWK35_00001201 [Aphis craccivora]
MKKAKANSSVGCADGFGCPSSPIFLVPDTISSILTNNMAVSIAVLSFILDSSPVSPLIPQYSLPLIACLALNDVIVLMVLTPQFCNRVRGITSNASATAL